MRIAVWHNLPAGGGKRALYNHVLALRARGHYLEAWSSDYSSVDYLPLSGLITEHRKPLGSDLERIRKGRGILKRQNAIIRLMKKHAHECVDEIHKGGFDLIFANSCSVTAVPFISLFSEIPVILFLGEPDRRLFESETGHNIWTLPNHGFSLKGLNRFRKDLLRNYSARLMVREQTEAAEACSKILVNSAYSRESVKRAYGTDSAVCYLGIDEKAFSMVDGIKKEKFIVGMGRISPAKNPEMAINAVSLIPKPVRPELRWISNDPVYDHLAKIIKLAAEKDVSFVPMTDLEDNEVISVLGRAAVMICTSHLEPFGLAPLEANMCSTAVIAVAEGGYRESIKSGENGFLVPGGDLNGMARLAERFVTDLQYAEQMGGKARLYAEKNWNFSLMSENIENALLRSVI